jgi:NADPH:quinone reductase-like Zn-dependent oxidoreductase
MLAVMTRDTQPHQPLGALAVAERRKPVPAKDWTTVRVRAAALNHHDLWTLRGVGVDPARLPLILGSDGAGTTADGREVIIHSVISSPAAVTQFGGELLDPDASILSERHHGTLAEFVAVPERNLLDKPPELSFEEAACLPTAYLTAYRALFTQAGLKSGGSVLIQGAGGGVATAALLLGKLAGLEVYVTSRSEERRTRAIALGADAAVPAGARLPRRVDAVVDSVGQDTIDHSLRALRPGGTVVVVGGTSGTRAGVDLPRLFIRQARIIGSWMGTRDELRELARLLADSGISPVIDSVLPLSAARQAFERLLEGRAFGKVVLSTAVS